MSLKRSIILGGSGFIGDHLVRRLKSRGDFVVSVDRRPSPFRPSLADEVLLGDLRDFRFVNEVLSIPFDEIYQLAAEMGGAEFVFTGNYDAELMRSSTLIHLNVLERLKGTSGSTIFFSSSACIYPQQNQQNPSHPVCSEDSAYPAWPDSNYGWEKLYGERLYEAFAKNYGLRVKVARLHNVFGPYSTWRGGREKSVAALCRKVAEAGAGDSIEVFGDGQQTRTFLYIDDCIEGILQLMNSKKFHGPVNLGSDELISIRDLAQMILRLSGKPNGIEQVAGPVGVRGRISDNRLIEAQLGWRQRVSLVEGLQETYQWVESQVRATRNESQSLVRSPEGSWGNHLKAVLTGAAPEHL